MIWLTQGRAGSACDESNKVQKKKERKPNQIDLNGSQQLSQTNSTVIVNAIEMQSKQNKGKLPIANIIILISSEPAQPYLPNDN